MRRRAVLQCIQQEAELLTLFMLFNAQNAKHGLLHVTVVDTHRSAADFITVDHHVVSIRYGLGWIGCQLFRTHLFRCRKRMVHGSQPTFVIFFKHREVDNPQRRPGFVVGDLQVTSHFQAQCAQRIGHHFGTVGTKEDDIPILRARAAQEGFNDIGIKEFRYRALYALQALRTFVYLHPGQAFGTVNLNKFAVFINLLTAQLRAAGNT